MKRALSWLLTKLAGTQIDAFTVFGRTVWLTPAHKIIERFDNAEDALRGLRQLTRHEAKHVEQQKREPILFYPKYLWQLIRHGYQNAPYEREATEAEGE
ncbi:MAG TPA: hypothetical protein VD948_11225 [Rhodothermales bacterium]|nr:hypothetical protein [Rhodothermales bacterium]